MGPSETFVMTHHHLSVSSQKQGRLLSEAQIACVLYECLMVLDACHSQRIMHGDIKPANFMLAKPLEDIPVCDINHPEPVLKAVDFGCSRIVEEGEYLHELIGSPGTEVDTNAQCTQLSHSVCSPGGAPGPL